jgi:hypothetical protein
MSLLCRKIRKRPKKGTKKGEEMGIQMRNTEANIKNETRRNHGCKATQIMKAFLDVTKKFAYFIISIEDTLSLWNSYCQMELPSIILNMSMFSLM